VANCGAEPPAAGGAGGGDEEGEGTV
jgi:hypothetical protein